MSARGMRRSTAQAVVDRAIQRIEDRSARMQKAMDKDDLKKSLDHAAGILYELRTSELGPRDYYYVYMAAFGHMLQLQIFFYRQVSKGYSAAGLYTSVQHAGNVLTRLYLMVTAGSVLIRSGEVPAHEVLLDLLELCKGVQHPTRGLFLRYFLVQSLKDKLPEKDRPDDALAFLVKALQETNHLWVRLQTQSPVKSVRQRESDRRDLRVLVGQVIDYIAALEGVDQRSYRSAVLPAVLKEVVECNDRIAQLFLMDAIFNAFPLRWHAQTLPQLLETMVGLVPRADCRLLVKSLCSRLADDCDLLREPASAGRVGGPRVDVGGAASGAGSSKGAGGLAMVVAEDQAPAELCEDVFGLLCREVGRMIDARGEHMGARAVAECYDFLVGLARRVYCKEGDTIREEDEGEEEEDRDLVGAAAAAAAAGSGGGGESRYRKWLGRAGALLHVCVPRLAAVGREMDFAAVAATRQLLSAMVAQARGLGAGALVAVLRLRGLRDIHRALPHNARRTVSQDILMALLRTRAPIKGVATARDVLNALAPCLRDEPDGPLGVSRGGRRAGGMRLDEDSGDDLGFEQRRVAALLHQLGKGQDESSPREVYDVLRVAREALGQGGQKRLSYTLPALVVRALRLAQSLGAVKKGGEADDGGEDGGEGANDGLSGGYGGITRAEVFKFCFYTCTTLASAGAAPERALRLLLESALVAQGDSFAHECVRRALLVFEDVASSRAEPRCLTAVIATLGRLGPSGVGGSKAYLDLATRCTKTTTKLLTEVDRARCSLAAAKLFWVGPDGSRTITAPAGEGKSAPEKEEEEEGGVRNGALLLRCLQHALGQAEAQEEEPSAALFVEIADAYGHHLAAGVPEVVPDHVTMLLKHCAMLCASQQLSSADGYMDQGQEAAVDGAAGRAHLDRLQEHLTVCLTGGGERAARCAGVDVSAADEPSREELAETLGLDAAVAALEDAGPGPGPESEDEDERRDAPAGGGQEARGGASSSSPAVPSDAVEDQPPPPPSGPRPAAAGRAGDSAKETPQDDASASPVSAAEESSKASDAADSSGEVGDGAAGGDAGAGGGDDWGDLGGDEGNPFGDEDGL